MPASRRCPYECTQVANLLQNLGNVYKSQGRLEDAYETYERSMAIKRRVYGDDHIMVARAVDALAGVLNDQGRVDEARRMYDDALRITRKAYGGEHPQGERFV
jgi:tetratricopeptide (TPR) repeat protein